jgi:hypothetical protein
VLIRVPTPEKRIRLGISRFLIGGALLFLLFSPSPALPLALFTLGALLQLNLTAFTLWKGEIPRRPFYQSALSATLAMLLCDLLVGLGLYGTFPQDLYQAGLMLTWIVYLFGWSALLSHLLDASVAPRS